MGEKENGPAAISVDTQKGFKGTAQRNINGSIFLKAAKNCQNAAFRVPLSLCKNIFHSTVYDLRHKIVECLEVRHDDKCLFGKAAFEKTVSDELLAKELPLRVVPSLRQLSHFRAPRVSPDENNQRRALLFRSSAASFGHGAASFLCKKNIVLSGGRM
jgi:hypothetical protein